MKKITLLLTMSFSVATLFAQPFKTTIKSLEGEKWWGGYSSEGRNMPVKDGFKGDFAAHSRANQTSPLFVSSKGRYIWSEKPFSFEVKDGGNFYITSKYKAVEPVVAGKTLKEAYMTVSKTNFDKQGKYPNLLFFTQPQYNTWMELIYNQNQEDILKYVQGIKDSKLPAGIIMIDDNWQKYYGNYEFRAEKFSDPKAMIDSLHRDGFKVMVWVSPFVSPDSPEYRELSGKGYLLKDTKTGRPAMIEWWNGVSATYDLSNPKAFEYVIETLRDVQKKYGVDGFKLDAGDVNFYTGNLAPYDKNATSTDLSMGWSKVGTYFDFNEYRATYNMQEAPLVQRLCDKDASWGAVAQLIPDMLNAGLMGYSYTCPDMIGGGQFTAYQNVKEGEFNQILIVRSAQVHALMPMMQFSVAPWRVLDEEHLGYCRDAAMLRIKHSDYIKSLVEESANTGAPIVRNMEYEFPGKGYETVVDQFMLGNKYLVAPFLTADKDREVILPIGKWRDERGATYKGGKKITVKSEKGRLPYFEKL